MAPPSAHADTRPADAPDAGAALVTADAKSEIADDQAEVRTIELKGAPLVTVRNLGAALIEVTLAGGSGDPGRWRKIEIERHAVAADGPAGEAEHDSFEPPKSAADRAGIDWRRHVHSTTPGTTYAYRARSSGAWSPEVMLRVPEPTAAPAPPTELTVRPDNPFVAHLAWSSDANGVAGFEVQVEVKGEFVRAGLVDPTAREFLHHMRVPGQSSSYRVRSFNVRGASAPTPVATITMPETAAAPSAKKTSMGRCVSPPRPGLESRGCIPVIETLDDGTGHVVLNVPSTDSGCVRHLLGEYAGCMREFGVFMLQAEIMTVEGHSDEGWPLLRAIAGAGEYVGSEMQTLQFANGRYTLADRAYFCGEPYPDSVGPKIGRVDDDVSRCAPPFEPCQRDPAL